MKILSLAFVAILLMPSFQTLNQNFPEQIADNFQIKNAYAQPPVDIQQIGNYAVFGLNNMVLETNVTVVNGSAGAQNSISNMGLPGNAEINIGGNSRFLDTTSAIAGDSIIIGTGTTVQHVFYNEIKNSGTILGTQNHPLQLPLVQSLPSFPHSTPGTTSINVAAGASQTLQPGRYSTISVGVGGTLELTGGIYNVTSISTLKDAKLIFDQPSQMVVQNKIDWDKGTFVGPSTSSMHAHDIIIFVGNNGTINDNATDTSSGKNAVVKVNIYAPNGHLTMEKGTTATGAFIAKTLNIKQDSMITFDSAFGITKGTLTIIKKIINNDGGTLTLDGVTLKINGTTVTNGTANSKAAGNYIVSEVAVPGYASTISGDCAANGSVTLAAGDNKICTITNDDIKPILTVIKKIDNFGGGTLTISGVTLQINGTTVTNGTANVLSAGKYTVSENSIPDYSSTFSDDCQQDGTVTLNSGDVKTCIITNIFSIFFENFDSTLSGWDLYSSFTTCCGSPTLDQVTSAFGFPPPSLPYWGKAHVLVGGTCLFNNFVDFKKSFTVSTPGNYNVSATIGAPSCSGCIISGRVDVDHNAVLEQGGISFPGGSTSDIALKSAVINITSAGTHAIDLRMDTTEMCSGDFASYFDNISIHQTSSPVTSTPVGGPYFNVTLDQQAANVTRPSSVTVPLDVNWYQGWSSQPVSISFGNLTNTHIGATVNSIGNTTSYQEFNVIFNVPTTVSVGNYTIPITVYETGTDDAITTPFNLQVK
ncbi:MAG: hypothetical protein HY223_03025 [Thaumarchaeota archaeon]|nr:hypothetical protein [Nitrososphaerota archaeon]